jgi:hypothetical protein
MLGLEKLADAFDAMMARRDHELDGMLTDWVRGPDPSFLPRPNHEEPKTEIHTGYAIGAGLIWAAWTFSSGVSKSAIDLLRVGEGVRSGSLGGVIEDGMRVMTLGGPSAIGRVARAGLARGVAGGRYLNSCAITSAAFAMRLSGTRMAMTLDRLGFSRFWQFGSDLISPKSPLFPGAWHHEVVEQLNHFGVRNTPLVVSSLTDVYGAASRNLGPVLFGVEWADKTGHAMVAFKSIGGEIKVADQFGVRPFHELNLFPGDSAASGILEVQRQASIVNEAHWIGQLNDSIGLAWRAKAAADGVARVLVLDDGSWLTSALGLPFYRVPHKVVALLDADFRQQLGRPPREDEAQAAGEAPAATASTGNALPRPPLSPKAQKLLSVIPIKGSIAAQAARSACGLPTPDYYDAASELKKKSYVEIKIFGVDELNFISFARR